MTAPTIVATTANDWKKVATNVTSANLYKKVIGGTPTYAFTYVDTADPAPSGIPSASNAGVPFDDDVLEFEYPTGCDLYIYSYGAAGAIEVHA